MNFAAGNAPVDKFSLALGASWAPDLWGKVAGSVSAAKAGAQASEADLAGATLSAQASFVTDYLSVREADAEIAILQQTIAGYERALAITRNRYAAAIAQRSDVLQAGTTLASARADLAQLIQDLNEQMLAAARELQFELAARIRDEIAELKKEMRAMDVAGVR